MCLLGYGTGHYRMAVPQTIYRPAANKVQVLTALIVPHSCPLPPYQGYRDTVYSAHKVFTFKLLPVSHFSSTLLYYLYIVVPTP